MPGKRRLLSYGFLYLFAEEREGGRKRETDRQTGRWTDTLIDIQTNSSGVNRNK